jgi:hypothetical protein
VVKVFIFVVFLSQPSNFGIMGAKEEAMKDGGGAIVVELLRVAVCLSLRQILYQLVLFLRSDG